jgi:hypothetical protein
MFLAGDVPDEIDEKRLPLNDRSIILILNSHHENMLFTVPDFLYEGLWEIILDTKLIPGWKQHSQRSVEARHAVP